jgi:tRNA-specific 2-thiouridylase
MSGGVDSSVAAARLVHAGHEVIGLSMQLYDQREGTESFGSCCSIDDLHDARRVAHALGIPHYIVNFEREFDAAVVQNFVAEYAAGRTPIPCVRCNSDLKFAHLVEKAAGFDATAVATGHYARVMFDEETRRFRLLRGADPEKDQSYFLFSLTQEQLSRALFPVGDLTKAEVRQTAKALGLSTADKPDSHEICFVPDGNAANFVGRRLGESGSAGATGNIVDTGGKVLGQHQGIHRFTVGQRKGLGLATGSPMYVLKLNPIAHEVVVGPKADLGCHDLSATGVNWVAGAPPPAPVRLTARIRHRHVDAPGTLTPDGTSLAAFAFDTPQLAITPGQAVVFYDGDEVVGGGWIAG